MKSNPYGKGKGTDRFRWKGSACRGLILYFVLSLGIAACDKEDIQELGFFTVETAEEQDILDPGEIVLRGQVNRLRTGDQVRVGFILRCSEPCFNGNQDQDTSFFLNGLVDLNDNTFEDTLTGLSITPKKYVVIAIAEGNQNEEKRVVEGDPVEFSFQDFVIGLETASPRYTEWPIRNDSIRAYGFFSGLLKEGYTVEDHGFLWSSELTEPEFGDPELVDTFSLGESNDDGYFRDDFRQDGETWLELGFYKTFYIRSYARLNGEYLYSDSILQVEINGGWKFSGRLPVAMLWPFAVASGSAGYVGLGCNPIGCGFDAGPIRELFVLDPDNIDGEWPAVGNFDVKDTLGREAIGFVIGDYLYYGLGEVKSSGFYTNSLWRLPLDAPNPNWELFDIFPGTPRAYAVSFVIDGKAYIGSGRRDNIFDPDDDFYQFDPDAPQGARWVAVEPLPIARGGTGAPVRAGRSGAVGFALNGKGYVGLGSSRNEAYLSDFWEFTPPSPTDPDGNWALISSPFPGAGRNEATGFSLNQNTGLVGLGNEGDQLRDFYFFRPNASPVWEPIPHAFPGPPQENAFGFSIQNVGFIGAGRKGTKIHYDEIWRYFPDR